MPYTKTTWVEGSAPGISAAELNRLETQYDEAVQSFPVSLFDPFVLSGCTAAVNATVANQLDFTGGTAYPKQTDNTLRKCDPANATFTTSVASTTYYLDLNPDGTLSWGTAHSAQANYMPLYEVATDASANISTVTDKAQRTAGILLAIYQGLFLGAKSAPSTVRPYLYANGLRLSGGDVGNTIYNESRDLYVTSETGKIGLCKSSLTDGLVYDATAKKATYAGAEVARIIKGSYTGDGTADRLISVGFPPKMVWAMYRNGDRSFVSVGFPENSAGRSLGFQMEINVDTPAISTAGDSNSTTANEEATPRIRAASNGFLVTDASPISVNESAIVYDYYALV